jgi:glycosyltransferase involved in cell wall biosynthesis
MSASDPPVPGLVSVVMPAFHADQCILEALESIRRQDHPDWEVVVVEDGSQGATESLVRGFAAEVRPHRVEFLRNETNQGPSASRNAAIAHARGQFVAFLDADDFWMQGHLAESLRALEEEAADVAYSTAVEFEDGTNTLLGLWGPTQRELKSFPKSLLKRPYIIPSATVLRRRVLDVVGLFDPAIRFGEDLDLWLRCLEAGTKFVHVGGCHCLWRKGRAAAASSNLRACAEGLASVLQKNEAVLGGIPERLRRECFARGLAMAARGCLRSDARQSRELFLRAWRLCPARLDFLGLAVLACFPFVVSALRRLKHALAG